MAAPRPGAYRYRFGDKGPATTVTVTRSGATRVEIATALPGGALTRRFDWGADVVRVLSVTDPQTTCTWEPPLLDLRSPLAPGATWTSTASCRYSLAGVGGIRRRTEKVDVLRHERIKVGGDDVDALVVRRTATLVADGPTAYTQRSVAVEHVLPERGLLARSLVELTTTTAGGREARQAYTLTLLALDPVS